MSLAVVVGESYSGGLDLRSLIQELNTSAASPNGGGLAGAS